MVRKIHVVDLNELGSIETSNDTAVDSVSSPDPIVEVETPTPKASQKQDITEEKPLRKGDVKATCKFCNKLMSVKALRYSHDKNC